jgi:hypothetical protein
MSKTAGGIAAGVLTVLLIIGGIAIKLGARALTKAVARGSSSSSWDWGTSSAPTWDEVLAAKNQMMQEIIDEALALRAAHNGNVPFDVRDRFLQRVREKASKIEEMANKAERKYGSPSPTMMAALREIPSVEHLQTNFSSTSPSSTLADMQAQMEARRQQQEAERLARQQEYENARQAAEQRAAEQREANRIALEQRIAEQQARDQERRDRLNALANNPPPPFNPPPQFNPPQFNAPAPPAEPQQPEAPPGFPAVDLAQIKLKDNIFVSEGDKWLPAIVTLKRGKLVQVRSVANGAVAVVTLDRIRLQNEPVAKANAALPGALQAVDRKPAATGKNEDSNDDALFIAKPPAKDEPAPSTTAPETTPVAPPSPVAPVTAEAAVRTWSDSTGEFKVAAELVGFEFGLVQLKRQDGKILSVPLEKLSPADQQIVRQKYK